MASPILSAVLLEFNKFVKQHQWGFGCMRTRLCPTGRHSWIFRTKSVSQMYPPPPPHHLPSSPSYGSHYDQEKASRYPLLPPTLTVSWLLGWRGGKKKTAKCERGLVSMPTVDGGTYASSQGPCTPLVFVPLRFSSRLPSPSLLFLSVGEIRVRPMPGIKPYLSSWV